MILRLEVESNLLTQAEAAAKARGLAFNEFVMVALRSAVAQTKFTAPSAFTQKVHDFGAHLESPWSLLAELETNAALMRK
ncbi:MAG: hypothetical protein ACXW3Z_10300 [Limisphaerales bacterium]